MRFVFVWVPAEWPAASFAPAPRPQPPSWLLSTLQQQLPHQLHNPLLRSHLAASSRISKGLNLPPTHRCPKCGKWYQYSKTLRRHLRHECGLEPQFRCLHCPYRCKQKAHLVSHLKRRHPEKAKVN